MFRANQLLYMIATTGVLFVCALSACSDGDDGDERNPPTSSPTESISTAVATVELTESPTATPPPGTPVAQLERPHTDRVELGPETALVVIVLDATRQTVPVQAGERLFTNERGTTKVNYGEIGFCSVFYDTSMTVWPSPPVRRNDELEYTLYELDQADRGEAVICHTEGECVVAITVLGTFGACGTTFSVKFDREGMTVLVYDGAGVATSDRTGEAQGVTNGHRVTINEDGSMSDPEPFYFEDIGGSDEERIKEIGGTIDVPSIVD